MLCLNPKSVIICMAVLFLFFAAYFEMRRFALNDAESQVAIRVLAEFHVQYQQDQGTLDSYMLRLHELRDEFSQLRPLQSYVDDVASISKD